MIPDDSESLRADAPRSDRDRDVASRSGEWEVFVREGVDEPLRHAGSVSAPTREAARDRSRTLLGWATEAVWLCPAEEVERFHTRDGNGNGNA